MTDTLLPSISLSDESFLVLYQELRFRHIYAKHKVSYNYVCAPKT